MTSIYTIEIQGGLANRLRTLWAAKAFANQQRKTVILIWRILPELGCSWQPLFSLNTPIKILTLKQSSRLGERAFSACRHIFSTFGHGLNRPIQAGIPWEHPPRFGTIKFVPFQWIQTCEEFADTSTEDPPFQPNHHLSMRALQRINVIREKHESLMGVHIRRGDHLRSTKTSTLNHFKEAIEKQIDIANKSAFLICSDDNNEVELLKSRYGKRIAWHPPRSLDRSNQISIEDAMIDMLSLSQCDQLLGSYLSSFSIVAAKYGKIPLQIAGSSGLSRASFNQPA